MGRMKAEWIELIEKEELQVGILQFLAILGAIIFNLS